MPEYVENERFSMGLGSVIKLLSTSHYGSALTDGIPSVLGGAGTRVLSGSEEEAHPDAGGMLIFKK